LRQGPPASGIHLDQKESTMSVQTDVLPAISVLVPFFGIDAEMLYKCLEAISKQTYPIDKVSVLVVDNNRRPAIIDATRIPHLDISILHEPKPGQYAARNRGILAASAPILAFTDADCTPDRNWLTAACATLSNAGGEVVVAGHIQQVPKVEGRPSVIEYIDIAIYLDQEMYVRNGHAATANVLVPAKMFSQYGLFDENYLGSGDKQWTSMVNRAGVPIVYSRASIVRHYARGSLKSMITNNRRRVGGSYRQSVEEKRSLRWLCLEQVRHFHQRLCYLRTRNRQNKLTFVMRRRTEFILSTIYFVRLVEALRLTFGGQPERR
jgi:glycosyltransferase involved in cell wall biosynthesis